MTSTTADNRGSPSTTEKDIENGASEKNIETTQDEGQNNREEAADTNDNDDGKIV